jgi:tRNA pseudouridine32 synthase / 23S rRNA pseudouridine746 synthase
MIPTLNGVGSSCVNLPAGPWPTMLAFLFEQFNHVPHTQWLARVRNQLVLNGNHQPISEHSPYLAHSKLYYYRHLENEVRIPFEAAIIYEDEHLVVADKPHFLPTTPGGQYLQETLLVRLKNQLKIDTLSPLHRLDRETAGLVLFSKKAHERHFYHDLFRDQAIQKTYEAIAPLRPDLPLPTYIQSRITQGPMPAYTAIECTQIQGHLALYTLRPATGQKHQLRIHMNSLNRAILGDRIYPIRQPIETPPSFTNPLQLLAKHLSFVCPITRQHHHFESRQALVFK